MALLGFVGVDKTGKSTLFQGVLKKTNRHIVIDRFTACQYVYGKHHGRIDTPKIEYLREVEMALSDYAGIIYVEADVHIIKSRFAVHNEKDIELDDIEKVIKSYRDYINDTKTLPVLYLNTTDATIEECVDDIIRFGDWIDQGEEFNYAETGPGRVLF